MNNPSRSRSSYIWSSCGFSSLHLIHCPLARSAEIATYQIVSFFRDGRFLGQRCGATLQCWNSSSLRLEARGDALASLQASPQYSCDRWSSVIAVEFVGGPVLLYLIYYKLFIIKNLDYLFFNLPIVQCNLQRPNLVTSGRVMGVWSVWFLGRIFLVHYNRMIRADELGSRDWHFIGLNVPLWSDVTFLEMRRHWM